MVGKTNRYKLIGECWQPLRPLLGRGTSMTHKVTLTDFEPIFQQVREALLWSAITSVLLPLGGVVIVILHLRINEQNVCYNTDSMRLLTPSHFSCFYFYVECGDKKKILFSTSSFL